MRPYFLFRALWSRHITVKHTGSYDGTSISGFTSRKVHTSSTPQLKTQLKQSNTIRYIIASLSHCLDKVHKSYQHLQSDHTNITVLVLVKRIAITPTSWRKYLHRSIFFIQWSEEDRNRKILHLTLCLTTIGLEK